MAEKKNPVRLLRAWWDEAENRHDEGETLEVSTADAKAMIEAGVAVRADPLPGEA